MGSLFRAVPAPAGNGSGAAVSFADFGALKTIIVSGDWTLQPTINVEVNNATLSSDGGWQSVFTSQGAGSKTLSVCARWIRVTIANYRGGMAPVINIGGDDSGTSFAALVAPAGNGVGASVDVSALPELKSVQVAEPFRGSVIVEISADGGTTWGQEMAFSAPGLQTAEFAADFMRVRRNGVPQVNPGLPVINIGACDVSGGGGGDTAYLPWVNIEDYGAVSGDDSSAVANANRIAIQDAIADAQTLGKSVLIPPGVFYVNQTPGLDYSILISGREGLRVWGVRGHSAIKHIDAVASSPDRCQIFRITNSRNIQLDNFTCDGNWGNATCLVDYPDDNVELPLATIHTTGIPDEFPAGGGTMILVNEDGEQQITYTSHDGNDFAGCVGGTGLVHYGDVIGLFNKFQGNCEVSALSDGDALPQATINVGSAQQMPNAISTALTCRIFVTSIGQYVQLTYTGKTATTLTGCVTPPAFDGALLSTNDPIEWLVGQGNQTPALVSEMQVESPKNHAITVYGSTNGDLPTPNDDVRIVDMDIVNAYGDGIWIGAWSYNTLIENCTLDLCARNGITLSNFATGVKIHKTRCTNIYTSSVDSEPVECPTRDVTIDDCDFYVWWDPAATYQGASGFSSFAIAMSIVGGTILRPAAWNYAQAWRVTNSRIYGAIEVSTARDVHITDCRIVCDFNGGAVGYAPVVVRMTCDDVWVESNYVYAYKGNTSEINRGAISLIAYPFSPNVGMQPCNLFVIDNKIHARGGGADAVDGIYVEAYGGFIGIEATVSAYTPPSAPSNAGVLTFPGGTFTGRTNFFIGHQVLVGGVLANVIGNNGDDELYVSPIFDNYTSGVAWANREGQPMPDPTFPATAVLQPTGGRLHLRGNQIDCRDTDGAGAGRYGIHVTTGTELGDGTQYERIEITGNDVLGADDVGIRVANEIGLDINNVVVVGNHVWDNQPTITTETAIEFEGAEFITPGNFAFYGNTTQDGIDLVIGIDEADYWFTGGSNPSSYAGTIDPEGVVFAAETSIYQWLDAKALFMKNSSIEFNTGWIELEVAPVPGIRGFSTVKGGIVPITWANNEMPPSVAGDVEVLIISNTAAGGDPGAPVLSTPARFVQQVTQLGVYPPVNFQQRGTVLTRRRVAGDVPPVIANAGGQPIRAVIVALKNLIATGVALLASSSDGTADGDPTNVTAPGLATSLDNAFILNVVTWFGGLLFEAENFANPDQVEITKVLGSSSTPVDGNFPEINIATGRVPVAMTIDPLTAEIVETSPPPPVYAVWTAIMLAFAPYEEPAFATGSITCVATALMADTDTVTIGDGMTPAKTYQFNATGGGSPDPGNIEVDISADVTAAQVATTLAAVVFANQPSINLTPNGNGTITIIHGWTGAQGNVTITENVADAGFTVSGLAGGAG